jgi:subtilisin family serine protease
MPIFIVRPKRPLTHQLASVMTTTLSIPARQSRLDEITDLRSQDPIDLDIRKWVGDSDEAAVRELARPETDTRITGTRLLEMSQTEADKMKRDLPDALVIPDQPLELIQPQKLEGSTTDSLKEDDLWHLERIGLRTARKNGYRGTGAGTRVAVLDTGIDPHPEVASRVDSAWTLDVPTWKAAPVTPTKDTLGHGTQVAGIIAGKTVGIAPGASLINVIMLPKGFGKLSDFILAMEWVGGQLDPPVQIVNMSAGLRGYLPEMQEPVAALLAAGILPVFAIGNEGRNNTRSPGNYKDLLSVGSSARNDRVSAFSGGATIVADSHQYTVPDLVAPGEDIYSCKMGGGYEAARGTSEATPIVSAIACLVLERYPHIEVPALIDEILHSCQNIGEAADRQGRGVIQVTPAVS